VAVYIVGAFGETKEPLEPDFYRVIPDLEAETGEIPEDTVYSLSLSPALNELLAETEYPIPPIEFGQSGFSGLSPEFWQGRNSTMPTITLSTCERSEKERIVRLDAYTLYSRCLLEQY
jgi:hypothetical protein